MVHISFRRLFGITLSFFQLKIRGTHHGVGWSSLKIFRTPGLAMASSLLLTTLLPGLIAGERLEYEVVQASSRERVTIYIQGTQARITSSANQSTAIIFDAKDSQVHILDHTNKSVTTIDQASLEQLAAIARGMGELANSQGGVLGDIFKTFGLDNQLGDTAQIEVKILNGERTYSGQACQMQQLIQNGNISTQLCLSGGLAMAPAERETLDSLIRFAQLLVQQGQMVLSQFNLPIPLLPDDPLTGTPVFIDDVSSNTTATLIGFKNLDVLASQFNLPPGYSRRALSL
jgi:hypothetical protein